MPPNRPAADRMSEATSSNLSTRHQLVWLTVPCKSQAATAPPQYRPGDCECRPNEPPLLRASTPNYCAKKMRIDIFLSRSYGFRHCIKDKPTGFRENLPFSARQLTKRVFSHKSLMRTLHVSHCHAM
jgi:hypothetical protein